MKIINYRYIITFCKYMEWHHINFKQGKKIRINDFYNSLTLNPCRIFQEAILIFFLLLYHNIIIAQLPEIMTYSDNLERFMESTGAFADESNDHNEYDDENQTYHENPININEASFEELMDLILLSELLVNNLINYRQQYGKIVSIFEMTAIEGFNRTLITQLLPCFQLEIKKSFFDLPNEMKINKGKHQFFFRYLQILQKQDGYAKEVDTLSNSMQNKIYLGGQQKLFTRYSYRLRDKLKFGISAEKDAGEEFCKGSQKQGFDFYSAFIYLAGFGMLDKLIIGDFKLQFGQGLTCWSGYSTGKSTDIMSIRKYARGIKPSSSANETEYFRGIAATIRSGKFEFSAFFSSTKADANLQTDDTSENNNFYIQSIHETGYHRTHAELDDRHTINKNLFGGHLSYHYDFFEIGITGIKSSFDHALKINSELYNQFISTDRIKYNIGLDYRLSVHKAFMYGEFAKLLHGGFAFIHGISFIPDPRLSFNMLYRYYARDYYSQYSNAFGENTLNNSESGLFISLQSPLHHSLKIAAYCDLFRNPWLKYMLDVPSYGNEFQIQAEISLVNSLQILLRYREQNKFSNFTVNENKNEAAPTRKQNLRLQFEYQFSATLRCRNRIEFTLNNKISSRNQGFMIYQDITYQHPSGLLSLAFRLALFDTDTYYEAIWAYENDVLYSISVPAYYYKGSRYYILFRYGLSKHLDLWLRYAESCYINRQIIGSGPDTIRGPVKSELTLQLRVKV